MSTGDKMLGRSNSPVVVGSGISSSSVWGQFGPSAALKKSYRELGRHGVESGK